MKSFRQGWSRRTPHDTTAPEAVIVAAVRSPIGRAAKGSLTELRPDDLATEMVHAALEQVPQLDPAEIDDLLLGCGEPYDEHGANMARRVMCASRWGDSGEHRDPAWNFATPAGRVRGS